VKREKPPKVCPVCGKETQRYGKHKTRCDKEQKLLQMFGSLQTLSDALDASGSIIAFCKDQGFPDYQEVWKSLKSLGLDVSLKRAAKQPKVREARLLSNLTSHGARHNFCRSSQSRKDWQLRLLTQEGISNVFQREAVKEKSLATFLARYGTEKWRHNLTVRGKGVISSCNRKVFVLLEELEIPFEIEVKLPRLVRGYHAYDVLVTRSKKIIEVYGDYWHMNPSVYESTDIFLKGRVGGEKLAVEVWEKDREAQLQAARLGYEVLVIWEKELKQDINLVKERIHHYVRNEDRCHKEDSKANEV
jgi:G:T-mismatch repair DNA endonuclease (very short patch repair protein)